MTSFEQAVSQSNVVFIVGSGLSAITSGSAVTATWGGLIRSGAERAQQLDPLLGEKWRFLVDGLLNYDDTGTAIQAAGMVASALRKSGEPAFAQWLSDDLGSLEVHDGAAAKALLSYPFPILTTNYDTLLEVVGGRQSTDWTDVRGFQDVVARGSKAIGHLHGVWDNPSSIVLTEADYERIKNHDSTQALERAVSALNSIVYVGFGAGLGDPNFSALLDWHRTTFPQSSVTHFRMCRSGEENELRRLHAHENVVPVVYGDQYQELAAFLRSHIPSSSALVINDAGLARDVVQETRELLRDSMTSESVLVEAGAGDLSHNDLVVPPVLLPVPHANFVRERLRRGPRSEVEHLDGYAEVLAHDFFVVVGDEGSGLSTAIKWLATQSSEVLGSAAPLFVRFADCRKRRSPLGMALVNVAMTFGLVHDRNEPLPAFVLALDDFNPTVPRVAETVLSELAASPAIVKIIGCPQGSEDELVSKLGDLGIQPRVLFLGRMRKSDITALAEKLVPGQGERLAGEALRLLDAEGLRRTPLTVSLLLYLLNRGGSREALNQTNMIDAYLSLLLVGVGDPHDDWTGLTETDVQAILSNLAESMIWDEKPSLPEHEAIRVISDVLMKYGWSANPSGVLSLLIQRRILSRHGTSVEFGRYAYFALFAAKRAMVDQDFRELILNDLFYYEPVATRFAALTRADEALLLRLRPLLQEELADSAAPGSPYELMPLVTVDEAPVSDELRVLDPTPQQDIDDDLEFPETYSPGSFGLVKAEMPLAGRMYRTLGLVSSILRDLDQVEKLDEKREVLVLTLELWGRFITAFSADSALKDLETAIVRNLTTEPGARDGAVDGRWHEFLARSIPAGTALSGMESTLVSPKLASALNDALERGELTEAPERVIATLFFLLLMRPVDWAVKAKALVEAAEPTWVVTHFFHALCENAYANGAVPENQLMDLCKSLLLRERQFATPDLRSAHLNAYAQRLRTARAHSHLSPSSDDDDTQENRPEAFA